MLGSLLLGLGVPILIIFLVVNIFNKPFVEQLTAKFKGRTEEIMGKDATTPEGAKDYFNAAIQEKEVLYNKAVASLSEVTGKRELKKQELIQLKKQQMKYTQNIEQCLADNDEEKAMEYADKRSTVDTQIETATEVIKQLDEMVASQTQIKEAAELSLRQLKEEKKRTVYQLESDAQMIELSKSLDDLATTNETDRMLEKVRDGAKKVREKAEGSRISVENSSVAKDLELGKDEQKRNARNILEEVRSKMKQEKIGK